MTFYETINLNRLKIEYMVGVNKKISIIETAARLFSSQDYEATTTLQIARETGITEPAVFYHFNYKNTLFAEIVKDASARYIKRIDTADRHALRPDAPAGRRPGCTGRRGSGRHRVLLVPSKKAETISSLLIKDSSAIIYPFQFVIPRYETVWKDCVPLTTLKAAAGSFSDDQIINDGYESWGEQWISWKDSPRFEKGMFVAQVEGKSMEPMIPDGSYCLFRQPTAGSRNGKTVLVWHAGIADPHTDGCFTVKVYQSEKTVYETGEWRHARIFLKPKNPVYDPIILEPEEEGEVRVIAEFVQVVG